MTPQQTKDLLIHAAKAAGLEGYTFQEATPLQSAMMVRRNIDEHGWDIGVQEFDSINGDADAFCLAVKLQLDCSFGGNGTLAHARRVGDIEEFDSNPCAAARLAITKAAAMTEGWKE